MVLEGAKATLELSNGQGNPTSRKFRYSREIYIFQDYRGNAVKQFKGGFSRNSLVDSSWNRTGYSSLSE